MDAAGISQVVFAWLVWLENAKQHKEGLNLLNKEGAKIQAPTSGSKNKRLYRWASRGLSLEFKIYQRK